MKQKLLPYTFALLFLFPTLYAGTQSGEEWQTKLTIHTSKSKLLQKISLHLSPLNEDIWQALLAVQYRTWRQQYIPEFDNRQRTYENKKVTIAGYMYPLEEASTHAFFMLSYYPINICFFCGGAGPESVVEVNMKNPLKLTDGKIKLTGTLRLNEDDPERLFYILLDAEQTY